MSLVGTQNDAATRAGRAREGFEAKTSLAGVWARIVLGNVALSAGLLAMPLVIAFGYFVQR